MTDWTLPPRPYAIAHRGASAYAFDNTIHAFRLAAELGADMWEVDIRLSRDGHVIVHHDDNLADGTPISTLDYADILARTTALDRPCPLLESVISLAAELGAGIYADIKDIAATLPALDALRRHGIEKAILGAFDPAVDRILAEAGCAYPRSILVPLGADPFDYAKGADVIHLCWEDMPRPQDTLTTELFDRAFANSQRIAIWHEEDPVRMAAIRTRPVIGICSDRPELVNPFTPPDGWPMGIVCHRGANRIAPENTLPAVECAFAAGFSYVEIDLHSASDGGLVVLHDATLDRTTDGAGRVSDQTTAELRKLDAGGWKHPFFAGTPLPLLAEVLALAQKYQGSLYLELKTADPAAVWAVVQAASMQDRVFLWSFDRTRLAALRALAPGAALMARRQDYPSLDAALGDLGPAIIEYTPDEDLTEFATLRARGLRPMIAYMGSDDRVFDRIIAARPDLVNLDQPFAFCRRLSH